MTELCTHFLVLQQITNEAVTNDVGFCRSVRIDIFREE
jgi:hypothetical protein